MIDGVELILQGGAYAGSFATEQHPAPAIIPLPAPVFSDTGFVVYHLWNIKQPGRGPDHVVQRYMFDHDSTDETGDLLPKSRVYRPRTTSSSFE